MEDDAKRRVDYKILANRGLTPHRKKELRNPRVKHRNKYEAAKKKLKSFRAVAVDRSKLGMYQGEVTGIKSDVARSSKF
jgi:U3 small nucleolar RNA-associated protein 3